MVLRRMDAAMGFSSLIGGALDFERARHAELERFA
jgi:hypothetical protein